MTIDDQFRVHNQRLLAARRAELDIVATTRTPAGHTLHWIPRDSQPDAATAVPPELRRSGRQASADDDSRPETAATPELLLPGVERGPAGTVPIRLPDAIDHRISMARRNLKAPPPLRRFAPPDPDYTGHAYANSGEDITCYGSEGRFSVFEPAVRKADHFSLIQTGLINTQQGYMQTVETGWQKYPDLYGEDWIPHVFVFFTTNGYDKNHVGDYLQGYNALQKGWVQISDTYYPGMTMTPYSVVNGPQHFIDIFVTLNDDKWWVVVQGQAMGYYPAWLYTKNGSTANTMGTSATHVGFWGEVCDTDEPNKPQVQMGSGQLASAGSGRAAYMHNLLYRTDPTPNTEQWLDYDGSADAWSTNTNWYSIDTEFHNTSVWRSYCYVGGPGA